MEVSIRGPRAGSGRAAAAVVALALLASLVLGGLMLLLGRGGDVARRAEGARPSVEREAAPPDSTPAEDARAEADAMPPAARDTAALEPILGPGAGVHAENPARFRGLGGLRGHVEARGAGAAFPESWSLLLEPSLFLAGQGHPIERRVEFTGGVRDFEIEDLPLGGYDVRIAAPGWNSRIFPVLLERTTTSPFVNLEIYPAGHLEGRLVGADKLPAEGIALVLEALVDGERLEATSDLAGVFRFESVLDGNYRLIVGHGNNPLIEPLSLSFLSPAMYLPDLELPPLGEAEFIVSDVEGLPLGGVSVRGSGTAGGVVEGLTGPDGKLLVRYLPAGHYRVRADLEGKGTRRTSFDLTAEERAEVHLRLE